MKRREKKNFEFYKKWYKNSPFESLSDFFNAIPAIEEKFQLKLPQDYKKFLAANASWGFYGENENFKIYGTRDIYYFNFIGNYEGENAIGEMKDYFIFAQDDGECSYFFDPFNKLGAMVLIQCGE